MLKHPGMGISKRLPYRLNNRHPDGALSKGMRNIVGMSIIYIYINMYIIYIYNNNNLVYQEMMAWFQDVSSIQPRWTFKQGGCWDAN